MNSQNDTEFVEKWSKKCVQRLIIKRQVHRLYLQNLLSSGSLQSTTGCRSTGVSGWWCWGIRFILSRRLHMMEGVLPPPLAAPTISLYPWIITHNFDLYFGKTSHYKFVFRVFLIDHDEELTSSLRRFEFHACVTQFPAKIIFMRQSGLRREVLGFLLTMLSLVKNCLRGNQIRGRWVWGVYGALVVGVGSIIKQT